DRRLIVGIGAAIAGASAAAGLASSAIGSGAASSAASTQAAAADQASANAMAQYQQTRSDLAPYRDAGASAVNQLRAIFGIGPAPVAASAPTSEAANPNLPSSGNPLANGSLQIVPPTETGNGEVGNGRTDWQVLDAAGNVVGSFPSSFDYQTVQSLTSGLNGGQNSAPSSAPSVAAPASAGANPLAAYGLSGLTFQPTMAQLEATPGYQFDRAQGLLGVANSNAAQGLGISGAALKGAAQYATGLANNTLTTQQGIFQQNLGNVLNPLMSLSSLGENAGAQTGSLGVQGVSNANNALIGGANASAAGTVGSANALANGLGSLGSSPLNYMMYQQLLGGGGGSGAIDSGTFD